MFIFNLCFVANEKFYKTFLLYIFNTQKKERKGIFVKVIFLDIDGVLQSDRSGARFEIEREELRERLSEKMNIDYSIYDQYDVAACYCDWDIEAVNRIKRIIQKTNAKIVISSDWRNKEKENKMRDFLRIWNLNEYLVGQTDYYGIGKMSKASDYVKNVVTNISDYKYIDLRQIEIIDYLFKHKEITNFVSIDDRNLSPALKDHFVHTDDLINDEQMKACIEILNGKDWKRI